ncbi:hypothetical protein Tco_1258825 [Tanacetum coccineum]
MGMRHETAEQEEEEWNRFLNTSYSMFVDPETNASLPRNQHGEICICGDEIVKGYPNDPKVAVCIRGDLNMKDLYSVMMALLRFVNAIWRRFGRGCEQSTNLRLPMWLTSLAYAHNDQVFVMSVVIGLGMLRDVLWESGTRAFRFRYSRPIGLVMQSAKER